MPLIKTKTSVPAGSTVFPWQGNQYEFLPFDAVIEVALVAIDDGTAGMIGTVYSGTDVLMQESALDADPNANGLKYPDDYDMQDVGAAGERLGCQLTNPAPSGSVDVLTAVRITPL